MKAPIALFVYNRPAHTRRTLESLSACSEAKESELFIFADGLKSGASEHQRRQLNEVREIIRSRSWCKSVHIIESEVNLGLSRSIIKGVTELLNRYGSLIILEDDMEVSPYFLKFMNDGLELYKDEPKVVTLTGYTWPVKELLPETFFLRGTYCWGWATWKRAWELFDPDGKKLLKMLEDRKLTQAFDFDNSHYYTRMLRDQVEGRNDSWALPWYAAAFLLDTYTLIPGRSLVQNTGIDGSGVHSGTSNEWSVQLSESPIDVKKIPVEDSKEGRAAVTAFFRKLQSKHTLYRRLQRKLKSTFSFKR